MCSCMAAIVVKICELASIHIAYSAVYLLSYEKEKVRGYQEGEQHK